MPGAAGHRRTAVGGIVAALVAATSAAACSAGNCSVAGPGWPDHVATEVGDIGGRPPHFELWIDRHGGIAFSGRGYGAGGDRPRRIEEEELEQLLAIADTMSPRPYLVVETSPDADCRTIRSLAAELERLSICREGRCVLRAAWEKLSGQRVHADSSGG